MSDASAPAKRTWKDFLPAFPARPAESSPYARALCEGLLAGALVFILLVVWMVLRSGDTARSLQPLVPVKVAAIEEPAVNVTPQDPNAPREALADAKNINALPPAPLEGLTESVDGKILPVSRIQDDMTPFQAYKKPFTAIPGRALVSIVVLDFGLSDKISSSMLDNLPPDVSLVLSPYGADLSKWASAARAYGHEFWLSLPMQAKDGGMDTGPYSILLNAPLEQNRKNLLSVLGSVIGYAGVVTQQDHALNSTDAAAAPVLKQILGRGLAIAESNPGIPAFGLSAAMQDGLPYVQNNFWIDADLRPDQIDRVLGEIELQATRKGKAVAFLHPYPIAVKKVQEWMQDAEKRGLQIAPLSAMAQ